MYKMQPQPVSNSTLLLHLYVDNTMRIGHSDCSTLLEAVQLRGRAGSRVGAAHMSMYDIAGRVGNGCQPLGALPAQGGCGHAGQQAQCPGHGV